VEQDVSVGELHTQDHTAFSSVEPININGEILLIDGTAPSIVNDENVVKEKCNESVNKNKKCNDNKENEENEIVQI
jgi:hypothetical protein